MKKIIHHKLPLSFYSRKDVVAISKELLGKFLFTRIQNKVTGGMIVETEAYAGVIDKASHAYNERRTNRTEVMYARGGTAYVYLCYGIYHLFNVVTNDKDVPHAILIRAIEPVEGIDIMMRRRKKEKPGYNLTGGPGVSAALGITVKNTGVNLLSDKIWIEDRGVKINPKKVIKATRIGVDYASEHALWKYRFYIKDNPWVSKK